MTPATTDRGSETRDRIVAAGRRLLLDKGYAGTSIADVMHAAEITKGGFYFHFDSKAQLALAVIEDLKARTNAAILAAVGDGPAIERLERLICGAFDAHTSGITGLGRCCQDVMAHEPELGIAPGESFAMWSDLTAALVREAQVDGDIPGSIDADEFAQIAVAAFFGLDLVTNHDPSAIVAYRDAFLRVMFRAAGVNR